MESYFISPKSVNLKIEEGFKGWYILYILPTSPQDATALEMLNKIILNGLNLNCNNFCFIELAPLDRINFTTLKQENQLISSKVILFGLQLKQIGYNFDATLGKIISFEQEKLVELPSLEAMLNDVATKKQAWTSIQLLFNP